MKNNETNLPTFATLEAMIGRTVEVTFDNGRRRRLTLKAAGRWSVIAVGPRGGMEFFVENKASGTIFANKAGALVVAIEVL